MGFSQITNLAGHNHLNHINTNIIINVPQISWTTINTITNILTTPVQDTSNSEGTAPFLQVECNSGKHAHAFVQSQHTTA